MLLGGALAYVCFFLYLPVGSGPAGPFVPWEAFQKPWTDRKVLLVGVGDSVTAGLGASRDDLSYFRRLVKNPADEFPGMEDRCLSNVLPNLTTLNIAVSGSNSSQHESTVAEKLPSQPADVFGLVVVTSGGNDLIHWYGRRPPQENAMYGATLEQAQPWIKNFGTRLDRMLTTISEKFPAGCLIFLADIYDPSDGVGDPESVYLPTWPDCTKIVTAYNDVIRQVAAQHANVRLVPLHDTFLGHGIHCRQFWRATYDRLDPTYWYYSNIEDPNDRGYDAIRRIVLLEMIKESDTIAGRED